MRGSPEDEGRERHTGSRREGHSFGGVLIDSIGENSFFEMLIEEEAVGGLLCLSKLVDFHPSI